MPTPTKSRRGSSGRSLTYAERAAGSRPVLTLSLARETVDALDELEASLETSRSRVVDRAVAELAQRVAKKDRKKIP